MGYKGEDLDLRTPQPRGAGGERHFAETKFDAARDAGSSYAGARGAGDGYSATGDGRAPILVDETILACCNHAFDVALAHRSAEVRLEHLLYALTRIDSAAEVLENHGIRDAALRRDSATVIATEIPVGLVNGKAVPRRSYALEQALRQASRLAMRRNGPATVADLLQVLISVENDLPGLDLLRRHLPGEEEPAPRPADYPQLHEAHAYAPPPMPPRGDRFRRPVRPAYAEAMPPLMPMAVPPRASLHETAVDSIQNSRLNALEQMVRALGEDLASERKAFAGMVEALARDVGAQREDHGRFSDVLRERLGSIEKSFASQSTGSGEKLDAAIDKVRDLEQVVARRLDTLVQSLEERLEKAVEQRFDSLVQTVEERLERVIERRLDSAVGRFEQERREDGRELLTVAERLRTLEGRIAEMSVEVDLMPLEGRLSDIETAILAQEPPSAVMGLVSERLEAVERGMSGRLEQLLLTSQADSELARRVDQRLEAIERGVAERIEAVSLSTQERIGVLEMAQAGVRSEVGRLADTMVQQVAAVDQGLANRVTALAGVLDTWQSGQRQTANRIETMEVVLERQAQESAESRETSARELREVHEALMKLNQNQHTLAGAIDSWRKLATSDMNTISAHLAQLDRDNDAPIARLELLSERLDGLYRATVERYHRRNRFWYWLFGTDDWLGASWPSQTAKVEEELKAVKLRGKV